MAELKIVVREKDRETTIHVTNLMDYKALGMTMGILEQFGILVERQKMRDHLIAEAFSDYGRANVPNLTEQPHQAFDVPVQPKPEIQGTNCFVRCPNCQSRYKTHIEEYDETRWQRKTECDVCQTELFVEKNYDYPTRNVEKYRAVKFIQRPREEAIKSGQTSAYPTDCRL